MRSFPFVTPRFSVHFSVPAACTHLAKLSIPSVSLWLSPMATSQDLYYPRTSGCCPFLFLKHSGFPCPHTFSLPVCLVLCGLFLRLSPHSAPPSPGATLHGYRAPISSLLSLLSSSLPVSCPLGLSRGLICTTHSVCPCGTHHLAPLAFKSVLSTSWFQILTLGTWEFLPPSAPFLQVLHSVWHSETFN